ncbi:hypothetical protein HBH55_045430 [Parastagonospora nodorum]|nr:hypothetical protein HBI05_101690 [Parastagonospora nodorum]KAH4638288.1 hypothetical protein HBH55_045430 [Parastagonospora nodorum]
MDHERAILKHRQDFPRSSRRRNPVLLSRDIQNDTIGTLAHAFDKLNLGLPELPATPPTPADLVSAEGALDTDTADEKSDGEETPTQTALDLHRVLLETCIQEGKLVCGSCGHEYAVKEGVANFLLPGHLV